MVDFGRIVSVVLGRPAMIATHVSSLLANAVASLPPLSSWLRQWLAESGKALIGNAVRVETANLLLT
jgi:hypothetical protein